MHFKDDRCVSRYDYLNCESFMSHFAVLLDHLKLRMIATGLYGTVEEKMSDTWAGM